MVEPKERSSPDNPSSDRPSSDRQVEKPLGRTDPTSNSSPDFDEAQHEKLLKMGLSYRMMVQLTNEHAIFALDRKGHVASWNDGAERIKGYKAEEIIGRHMSRFYTAEDVQRGHPANPLKLAESQGQATDEGRRVRKDGTIFWADISITALRDKKANSKASARLPAMPPGASGRKRLSANSLHACWRPETESGAASRWS